MKSNITGISGNREAFYASRAIKEHKGTLILVSTAKAAERFRDDLSFFVDREIVALQEEEEIDFIYEARDKESLKKRMSALSLLANNKEAVIIAPVSAAMKRSASPDSIRNATETVKLGERIAPSRLRKLLSSSGYEQAPVTESPGEFSVRGDILDLFIPSEDNPVRIEFFDDEIDQIKYYDRETQRSIEPLKEVSITPAVTFMPSEDERRRALDKIKKRYEQRIEKIIKEDAGDEKLRDGRVDKLRDLEGRITDMFETGSNPEIFEDFISYFDEDTWYMWDFLGKDDVCIVCDPQRLIEELGENVQPEELYKVYDASCDIDVYTPFPEQIRGLKKIDRLVNVRSRQMTSFNGQIQLFISELKDFMDREYEIHVVASNQDRLDGIKQYINDAGIYGSIIYDEGTMSNGMVLEDERLVYFSEADIFPQTAHRKKRRKKRRSADQISFSDLHKGDYVVHEEHGIGRFEGIKKMEADGEIGDYLEIHYADSDVLYIPTSQMDMVQRYIGSGGNAPHLSKLSGGSWRRTRAKAKKAIEAIAEDLVQLYAEREASGGYAFPEDDDWQRQFEEAFPYEETDDQLQATAEIKADMEKPVPMDRLLCGDVGYGKTEVAARAIFKCLAAGKQAVLLAPTTLLVNQHYNNMVERFEGFPFNIEMLSRFRTDSEQAEVLNGLETGKVDFVIGTHRLLSDDIKFKDLGLLVVDEEQRFGVKAKEKIKTMRKNVDVLTLSATPIPRTLNMSLTGIKNISMITEPPQERYPVQTYVSAEDDELIRRAIVREMERGGQTFVIFNRINGINTVAERIRKLVPEADVAVGHGRMDEKRLEDMMIDFVDGKHDVLVATTIIENGIDIPNANTMIILNADKLGMSQLYQLRGRVGRSNRIAYAYLMYKPAKVLSETARKRLMAIREFTEFGAGFKLAMRDLEIRGSGNVLGEAQSGHIAGIGYELYCKEVDRAVRRLKGEPVMEKKSDVILDLGVPARIPDSYISDETLKLQAYKKIAEISSVDDAEDVYEELLDRFGDLPDLTMNLIYISEMRAVADKLGIERIAAHANIIEITLARSTNVSASRMLAAGSVLGDGYKIRSGAETVLRYVSSDSKMMTDIIKILKLLLPEDDSGAKAS